jgi:GTPase SAR1 family protein
MKLKGIVLIVLYILIIAGITLLGTIVAGGIGSLLGIILGALMSSGATIFKPFRDWLENFVDENIVLTDENCRVLVFGLPRSGKTSLIKRIITADKPVSETSTDDFDVYDETLRLGLEKPKRYRVSFADYKGQKPSQITVEPPENFFGISGYKVVNAILFVVDFFPEIRDEKGTVLSTEQIVQKYETNAAELIKKRVDANLEYINKWTIEPVLTVCYSEKNLWSVRLLINKIDLLRDVISRGYLPNVNQDEIEKFAKKFYESLEKELREACTQNNIQDFSVHLISASTGENVRSVLGEILETYSVRAN